jgi:LPS export ABC transporter protein LptC
MTRSHVIAAVLALAALSGCNPRVESTPSPPPSVSPTSSGLLLRISGHGTAAQPVRIVGQQRGNRRQYDLLARSYESIGAQGSERAHFVHVHITFYSKGGSTLVADAPQAVWDQLANTITLSGGVKARNDTGTTLSCDTLLYDNATEIVHGTGHVVIASKSGFRASGNRFDSNIALTRTRMQ